MPQSKIEIMFELITPAYAGGADQTETDGLRPPTMRHLLRSWWRTMYPELSPPELFAREEAVFGSTKLGQRLRIRPTQEWVKPATDRVGQLEKDQLHVYFAYGAVQWDKRSHADPTRTNPGASLIKTERTRAGASSGMAFNWNTSTSPWLEEELRRTLWLLTAFGTFGSRSRRGWGSLRIQGDIFNDTFRDPFAASTREEVKTILITGLQAILGEKKLLRVPNGQTEPIHTSFSARTRLALGRTFPKWSEALRFARDEYNGFHRQLGTVKDHNPANVGPDFATRKGWLSKPPAPGDNAPLGVAFGLPQNATFTRPIRGAKVEVGVGEDLDGRRASPVFFKVLQCGEGFFPVALFLPSRFLPDAATLFARGDDNAGNEFGPISLTYRGSGIINDFFSGYTGSDSRIYWTGLLESDWIEAIW